jgi:hypothetical protein
MRRLTERPAYSSVTSPVVNTRYRGAAKRLLEMAAQRSSQRNVKLARSIVGRWAKGDFSASGWADADIDYFGPDLRGGRGVVAMASQWHRWLSSMDDLAVTPERFVEAGPDQVLVLARFSCAGEEESAPLAESAGVCLFVFSGSQVVRLSIFVDNPS